MYPRLIYLGFIFSLVAFSSVPGHYIVEMSGDPVAVHVTNHARAAGIRGAAALERRAQIREQQRPIRARLEAAQAEILDSVDTIANAFIVRIPDEKAAALESIPGVSRVYPVRRFQLKLDRALPLHHVPDAWQQVGIGNAGAGMKIAIIDTGIDIDHPGFQDSSLSIPSGFPRANNAADLAFTNNKVIAARSYADLFDRNDPDRSPRDRVGHGTATGMAAAGVTNTGPLAAITGVAPKAWLGSYKVFGSPGVNDGATDAAILKAIDDAVADGMDVINLSLGTIEATRPEDDIEVRALERASALGVIVVVAGGNEGPDPNTIGSPGTAPSAITVGASKNDRVFGAFASVAGGAPVLAVPGSGSTASAPVTAPLAAVAGIDTNGLACLPLPTGSLQGSIAFILRGDCTFQEKLTNVQRGGAVAALVYTAAPDQDPFTMGTGTATLPASMISYANGIDIQKRLAQNPSLTATLTFTLGEVIASTDGLVSFSSKGPSVDLSVKPDLLAVGTNFYTAAQKFDRRGILYDPNGYTVTQGTSFSSPLLAGAAAVLKAARPGLTNAQYRSLLINTASPWSGGVQQIGAGILNLGSAVRGTAAAFPTALSFQVGDGSPNLSRSLTISNISSTPTVFLIGAAPTGGGAPAPVFSADSISVAPGASAQIVVNLSASSLPPGQYEGSISVADTATGLSISVPYWYGVRSNVPKFITVLDVQSGIRGLDAVSDAVLFRITDSSGIAITDIEPIVTVVSGSAVVNDVTSRNSFIPGAFGVTLKPGIRRGSVVRIQAGDVTKEVTI